MVASGAMHGPILTEWASLGFQPDPQEVKMRKRRIFNFLSLLLTLSLLLPASAASAAPVEDKVVRDGNTYVNRITPEARKNAAKAFQDAVAQGLPASPSLVEGRDGYLVPDYFGAANWAYSPLLDKFIDRLPGLGADKANALGQYIPLAIPDTETYPGSDYYEIAVVEYKEQMHSHLPPTTNRGYVQLSTGKVPGAQVPLTYLDGTPITKFDGSPALAVDKPHYMGPAIVSDSGRPVRIRFYNLLPTGKAGDLFIPTDTTGIEAGSDSIAMDYPENRASIHLHGNNTVWISDGTPHQWITPAGEDTPYPQGVSVVDVPDMGDTPDEKDGTTTLYYTNTQSARLMFYHDQSYGITRLNVYAGEAAPYLIQDEVEKDLINGTNNTGVNPLLQKFLPDVGIPLVIQDRTFVDETTIMATDPTWAWGTNPYTPGTPYEPTTGDLWYPHVYSPAQNPYVESGVNPFGRWMYGPWFWPPIGKIEHLPVANPYHDPLNPDFRPPVMPGTPNPSAPVEAFMDTPIVNGTAYPYMEVDPKAYRFRILNAASDRFFNLQLYVADDTILPGKPGYLTEVKMVPAPEALRLPSHMAQVIPDPLMRGPDWIQIGTEGGFLPAPAVIPSRPATWNLDPTTANSGNINGHALLLGTAERADVIVDFSAYAGRTLILYNDAPAPFPSGDTRYDYHTGNEDLTAEGGSPATQPGKGPNIRTIMQIRVADTPPAAAYDVEALKAVFTKTADKRGVFEQSQEPVILPQPEYSSAYNAQFSAILARAFIQLEDMEKTFQPISKGGVLQQEITLGFQPKALHEDMGGVYDAYGRMGGIIGIGSSGTTPADTPSLPYRYAGPPVEVFKGIEDLAATPLGSTDDGTQIWKVTHHGVNTHTIHTHLFSAQLVNRVAWDGTLLKPDPNELGWKETFRVNPREITYLALRPKVPKAEEIPFDVPNSVRLIDPALPEGAPLMPPPAGWYDPTGKPIAQILNHKVNYGWEYAYHSLSSRETDMMHAMAVALKPKAPENLAGVRAGNGVNRRVDLTWTDASSNETGFAVQRSAFADGPWTNLIRLPAGTTTYSDRTGSSGSAYYYRVFAYNTVGDTQISAFPTVTQDSAFSNTVTIGTVQVLMPAAPSGVTAAVQTGPKVLLTWKDNSNDETGFVIQRATGTGAFVDLVNVNSVTGTGNISYADATVAPGTTYTYRIAATNSAGSSTYSPTASITLASPPDAPAFMKAVASSAGSRSARVTLTWVDSSDNETSFVIQRSTSPEFNTSMVASIVKADTTTFTAEDLTRNTPYYFRIKAINSVGASAYTHAEPLPVLTP
jgi:FtsP/CotA-like multicopper oxidase with cupredoxin domain